MSKSMNKYHKYRSELGSSLSGWVKVGALAVGVGVGVGMGGVPVPGGGVSKAWGTSGAYAINVEKGVFPSGTVRTSVVVKDVMKGLCESFAHSTEGMSVVFRGGFFIWFVREVFFSCLFSFVFYRGCGCSF